MFMTKKEIAFKERIHVGDRIQIKHLHELSDEDVYNVTSENIGKDAYLGRTLTVSHIQRMMNGLWYCLSEEDDGDFCWYESMIAQQKNLPTRKTGGLPNL